MIERRVNPVGVRFDEGVRGGLFRNGFCQILRTHLQHLQRLFQLRRERQFLLSGKMQVCG